jgi:hypothetical protein
MGNWWRSKRKREYARVRRGKRAGTPRHWTRVLADTSVVGDVSLEPITLAVDLAVHLAVPPHAH